MVSRSKWDVVASVVAVMSFTTGACGDNGTGPPAGALQLVRGNGGTDTILATLPQGLVVEVRDYTGALAPGTVVTFEALSVDLYSYTYGVLVAPLTSPSYSSFVSD